MSTKGKQKVPSTEIVTLDDAEEPPADESVTKTRIQDLKTLVKKLLQDDKKVSSKSLQSVFPGIKANEMEAVTKIVNTLRPYIPRKGKSGFIYKLPLILLANCLLEAIGKRSATVSISPVSSCVKLQALFIDTETIFSLFVASKGATKAERVMQITTFDDQPIKSASQALDNKSAVFSAFFDITAIHKICQSYHLSFANIIYLLPGCKTVRIMGTRSRLVHDLPPPSLPPEASSTTAAAERRAAVLKAEKEACQRELGEQKQALADFHRQTSIRKLKNEFNNTKEARQAIQTAKEKSHKLEFQVAESRRAIQMKKQEIQALTWVPPKKQPTLVDTDAPCYKRAEDSLLALDDIRNATFSGTDNGLITVTETVAFSLLDFKYHINLHNFTRKLDSAKADVFKPPPPSFKVNPRNCSHWRGLSEFQQFIKRHKSKQLQQVEKRMLEHPLNVSSPVELGDNYTVHHSAAPFLRKFYYSTPIVKRRRRLEFRSKKFKQKLCHRERAFCNKRRPPIMFIGDRGFGIGSTIKKHQRVGGTWKGKLHGSSTKVFVTNEFNSSQTCLYCFHKLSHTYKKKDGKKTINRGSFICHNPECVGRFRVLPRDRVSAMAIGLASLSQVLFGVTIPEFDPHPTATKSKEFNKKAEEFCRTFIV